jgi:hypothetical protein
MAFDTEQFRELVIDVLNGEMSVRAYSHAFNSKSAVELLLGTCAVESDFGTYLHQIDGPALGIFQMEPTTFYWIATRYGFSEYSHFDLKWDLRLAVLMARYRYWAVAEPLPGSDNIEALARYWKRYYNTYLGSGKVGDFITKYKKYVLNR